MNRAQWVERDRQWRRFREWEKTLSSACSLESRVRWFSETWEIARRFQENPCAMASEEKIERVRRLKDAFSKIKGS
jgi:hypothetical protein